MNTHVRNTIGFFIFGVGIAYTLAGIPGAIIAAILSVLEVSLSFDNAIVNAKELERMEQKWRDRFLTWGILIAVGGMRLLFPLLIVGVVARISPWAALIMAIEDPNLYKETIESAHISVMGFGGAFLFMVFFRFFLNGNKDVHWLDSIEHRLSKLGKIDMVEAYVTLVLSIITYFIIQGVYGPIVAGTFLLSGSFGVLAYISVDIIRSFLGVEDEITGTIVRTGLASFIYLEVLDSSFSFDGVIGAFAITNNLFIIAIGLSIGAYAVRNMTLILVEEGTLAEYRYLEHSAFWAIGCLAMIMYIDTFYQISEVITGLLGALIIIAGLIHSIIANRKIAAEDAIL